MKRVDIYTDGSCIVDKGYGGWSVVSKDFQFSGGANKTTNNQMELTAIWKAIMYAKDKYDEIHIYSDSQYAISTLTNWAYKWEANGWIKKGGIKNLKLIKKIFKLLKKKPNIHFHKVKAHDGNEMNEIADKLAKEAINKKFF